jgi:hypothetical protein
MSKKKKTVTTQQRVALVLQRLAADAKGFDHDEAEAWSESLENFLHSVHIEDGFGTEGQCDPRGDFRNGEWSMRRVEGLDK